jgi:hypothetical protein
MIAIRRIYIYVVMFAALATLAFGVANLVRTLLAAWVGGMSAGTPDYLRDQVAFWGAAALVGLPVWVVHWLWAQRLCRDASERASPLRRLFLYLVLQVIRSPGRHAADPHIQQRSHQIGHTERERCQRRKHDDVDVDASYGDHGRVPAGCMMTYGSDGTLIRHMLFSRTSVTG